MSATSEKISKKELQKLRYSRRKKPDPYEGAIEVIKLSDGKELIRYGPIVIPGYTYSM